MRCRSDCRNVRSWRRAGSPRAGPSTYDPPADVIADPHGLPFAENAVDLIVMPHALEFTDDPHLMLREAYRVIPARGSGRHRRLQPVLALRRQALLRPRRDAAVERQLHRALSTQGLADAARIRRRRRAPRRLRAAVRSGRSGCTGSGSSRQWATAGWPIAGGVYFLRATKKVLGMRVITPAWQPAASGVRRRSRRLVRAKD